MILKKILSGVAFLLFTLSIPAQESFSTVDGIARRTRKSAFSNPELLAKSLCKNLKTDREKARVIFTWIATNMRYDLDGVGNDGPEADSQAEYNEKRLKIAYRKGRGICMDYALLYQNMAEAVGLECAFVTGHSKSSVRGGWGNHAWNAVKINGKWELLDVTWGSGHVKDDGKFYSIFQAGYFFTLPKIFALDHFPEDEKWQLLETPLSKNEFKTQANFSYGDPDHDIQDAQPLGTPLSKENNGTITLRLKIKQAPSVLLLKMGGRELKFTESENDGWLTFVFKPGSGKELQIWGGESTKKGIYTTLMGVFPIK